MKNMKKVFAFGGAFCALLILTACGTTKKEGTVSCTLHQKNVLANYELDSTYKIYYQGDVVNKVETVEVIASDDAEVLSLFEDTLNTTYKTMNDTYGGYDYSVKNESNKVTATTTIDYTKLDLLQLVQDDTSMKSIVNADNKITLDGIKSLYTQMGAECE